MGPWVQVVITLANEWDQPSRKPYYTADKAPLIETKLVWSFYFALMPLKIYPF